MWIKHNNTIYNSDDISNIELVRTKIIATFKDNEQVIIGQFKSTKDSTNIFNSLTRSLLTENKDNPGIIIRDTRKAVK